MGEDNEREKLESLLVHVEGITQDVANKSGDIGPCAKMLNGVASEIQRYLDYGRIESMEESVHIKNVPVWCSQAAQDIVISGAIVARPWLEAVRVDTGEIARTIALRLKQEYDRLLHYLEENYPSLTCHHCGSPNLKHAAENGVGYTCRSCERFTHGDESFTFSREQWEKDILPRLFGDGTGTIKERGE